MELVSRALRHNFREFCSTIPLRQIDDMFQSSDIPLGNIPPDLRVSGERRTRVEQYYASLDWTAKTDTQQFLGVISFALLQDYVPLVNKDNFRYLCNKAGFHIEDDIISLPTNANGQKIISSDPPDRSTQQGEQQEATITILTRRDIIDQLCKGPIEGRLDLIEFLKMTWPGLDSMPSPFSRSSLTGDISQHMISFSDWEYDFLLYECLKLGDCSDELFTTFLASCIHPLVITDKKIIGELLSYFNEALRPDGYVFKISTYISGKPIYKAVRLNSNDSEHIVPRAIEIIEQLARGFHLVMRRLGQRHDHRPSIEIRDEYDVQDVFYAMLTPFFDDIRPEEVAPSHAGGHGRIDFLIKAEQIVIEIKKTRPTLKTKEIRDQLIVDKDIYRTHPHCKNFVAFVYDPDGYINNPKGFERDFSETINGMYIKVIVAPHY
jgi:hypothetical protein